jgi:hypothetical protein
MNTFLCLCRSAEQRQLPGLPDAVIVSILQQVPLRDGLACCALVCKIWASAAASTAMDLAANVTGLEECRQMQHWLEQSAGLVTSIRLTSWWDRFPRPVKLTWCCPAASLQGLRRFALFAVLQNFMHSKAAT